MGKTRLNNIMENFSKNKRQFTFENRKFEEFYTLYEQGKYKFILDQFNDISLEDPNNYDFFILKFYVLVENGQYQIAESLMTEFKGFYDKTNISKYFRYEVVRSFLLLKMNAYSECEACLEDLEKLIETVTKHDKDYLLMEALGNYYRIKGLRENYPGSQGSDVTKEEILDWHEKGLDIFHKSNNLLGIARQHNNLGRTFISEFQNFTVGLIFVEQSLAIRTFLGNDSEIAGSLGFIGLMNSYFGEYDLAEEYLLKSKEIRILLGNKDDLIITNINLAFAYFNSGDYEKLLKSTDEALAILDTNPNTLYNAAVYFVLMLVYSILKETEKISTYRAKALEYASFFQGKFYSDLVKKLSCLIEINSKSARKKVEAFNTFIEISKLNLYFILRVINLNSFIINQILNYLFEEFSETEDLAVIQEFDNWLNKLEEVNVDYRGILDLAKSKLLKSRLLLLQFKIEEAKDLLLQTKLYFDEKEIHKFSVLFQNELEKLIAEENIWLKLKENETPLLERISYTGMGELIGSSSIQKSIKQISTNKVSIFQEQEAATMLENVLPKEIISFLQGKNGPYIESFESISVLFADVVGFTSLSQRLDPVFVVESLNEIFRFFDSLLQKYDAEKIRTVGDNYMLCIGAPRRNENHAELICSLALELRNYIQERRKNGSEFNFRIGINSGPAVGGVIGTTKYHFDIWSDTVNIASRMESSGEPGKIQLTETSYQLVKDKFTFEERELIEIKGKGKMKTYYLLK